MSLFLQGHTSMCQDCEGKAEFVVIGNRNARRAIIWQVRFCKHCKGCNVAEQLNSNAIMDLFFGEQDRIITMGMVERMVERGELLQK